ncbi:hypothetical protein [Saccharospirillum impatiens]|uniref:hypothetical protein n=1 Tax=Saccharospirillum impatiens TaxID=169438 RepID=UPI00041818EF|nr:hypothetical protein [Saccharospirillum impatiens]
MKPGISLVFVSFALELVSAYFILFYRVLPSDFELILLFLIMVRLLGLLMMLTPLKETGAYMTFLLSIPFVPLGFIGMLGARHSLNYLKRKEFEQILYDR